MRTWLQTRHLTWLTPRRLRAATIALMVVAFVVPSVALTGSTKRPAHQGRAPVEARPSSP